MGEIGAVVSKPAEEAEVVGTVAAAAYRDSRDDDDDEHEEEPVTDLHGCLYGEQHFQRI